MKSLKTSLLNNSFDIYISSYMEWITSFLLNAMDFLLNILQVSHFCIIFLLNVSLRVISKNANV